jgi:hypothetical protein
MGILKIGKQHSTQTFMCFASFSKVHKPAHPMRYFSADCHASFGFETALISNQKLQTTPSLPLLVVVPCHCDHFIYRGCVVVACLIHCLKILLFLVAIEQRGTAYCEILVESTLRNFAWCRLHKRVALDYGLC